MILRNDIEVKSIRKGLCHFHQAIVIREEYDEEGKPVACSMTERHRAFIEVYRLAEEEK
ncbi:hypothetical protein KEJ47_05060 [Candidatus Bathyarchaeota archaeon]|nr:hypothetical protein [Candidatus Bathyarchaeota archaeon]